MLEFARSGGSLEAEHPASDFHRLLELLAAPEGHIRWRLDGQRRPRPEGGADSFLHLQIAGTVSLECIRCLKPVEAQFGDERLFKIAATEAQAEREDAQTDDYDALVASRRFDVLELVEDEAILALPIAPRHADCGLPAEADAPAAQALRERPNPFAVLAGLRDRRPDDGPDDAG